MDAVLAFFSEISNLGKYLMVPLMIAIIGIVVRCQPEKAIKGGITVGIGLFGLDLVMTLVTTYLTPITNALVNSLHLSLNTVDVGWAPAAGLAYSTTIGAIIIPFALVINIAMLSLRATKTMNIDVWNFWHFAFSGSIIFILTNNLACGLVAAAVHCVLALTIADRTAEKVQKVIGIPGISIPQGSAVTQAPLYWALEKFYNLIFKKHAETNSSNADASISKKLSENIFIKVLKDPIYVGFIIGVVLAAIAQQTPKDAFTTGMAMAALVYLLPRMVKVIMEGLVPISNAARSYMNKKYKGQQLYIGMDSAIILGHPTSLIASLLIIPVVLVLAMVLPGNTMIPLATLASLGYNLSMATVAHNGNLKRVMVSGTVFLAIEMLVASFFAPMITEIALSTGGTEIPEGATFISAFTAGNYFTFILYWLNSAGPIIGIAIGIAIIVATIIYNRRYFAKQSELSTTEFTGSEKADTAPESDTTD